jgi:hypothetical protein
MNKVNLIVIVSLLFLVACNNQNKKTEKEIVVSTNIAIDTLQQNFQQIDLEIEETNVCFDTLKIVSGNHNLLWNPFGIYDNIDDFLDFLPKEVFVKEQINDYGIEIYLVQINNSQIKVSVSEDWYSGNIVVNLVNAEIRDNVIVIANCIKTGMTKQAFIEMLNLKNTSNSNEIKVVELISVIEGIWQYYTFNENDILTKIAIKSDYVFE